MAGWAIAFGFVCALALSDWEHVKLMMRRMGTLRMAARRRGRVIRQHPGADHSSSVPSSRAFRSSGAKSSRGIIIAY